MIYSSIIFNDISLFSDIYRASLSLYTKCTVLYKFIGNSRLHPIPPVYLFQFMEFMYIMSFKIVFYSMCIADVYRSLYGNLAYYLFVSIVYEL